MQLPAGTPNTAAQRMVRLQMENRDICDPRVLEAMRRVPRHLFVSAESRVAAYEDHPLPIGHGQTISQPYMVAFMTQALQLRGSERVLEIGTGSGYQTAVLAWLSCRVVSIERHAELAEAARVRLEKLGLALDVEIRVGDGSLGAPDAAPFSGIVVTAAAPRVPQPLRDQLAEGGRLVIPVGPRDRQELMVVVRHGDEWRETSDGPCVFVPLVGEEGFA
jgi:protein-L-isoaspartate(D-aspartate) O-methyltransferase